MFLEAAIVILLGIVVLRLCVGWFVSSLCAKLFHCRQVKIGKVGFMSLTHLTVSLECGVTIELDKIIIGSSFFSYEYQKPVVLRVSDVRVDVSPRTDSRHQAQSSKASPVENRQDTTARVLYWLQFVSVEMTTCRAMCLDKPVVNCLLHLSLENLKLDTFRTRDGIQIDLTVNFLNAKLLKRWSEDGKHKRTPSFSAYTSPSSQSQLMNLSLGFIFSTTCDASGRCIQVLNATILDPHMYISDGVFDYWKSTGASCPSENCKLEQPEPSVSSSGAVSIKPDLFNLTVTSFTSRFETTGDSYIKTLVASVKEVRLQAHGGKGTFSLEVNQISLSASNASFAKVSSVLCMKKDLNFQWSVLHPTLSLIEDDLYSWIVYWKALSGKLAASDEPTSPTASTMFTNGSTTVTATITAANSIKAASADSELVPEGDMTSVQKMTGEIEMFRFTFVSQNSPDTELGIALLTYSSEQGLDAGEIGVESGWCRQLVASATPTGDGSLNLQSMFLVHTWGTPVLLGGMIMRWQMAVDFSVSVQAELDQLAIEVYEETLRRFVPLIDSLVGHLKPKKSPTASFAPSTMSSPSQSPTRQPKPLHVSLRVRATGLAVYLPVANHAYSVFSADKFALERSSQNNVSFNVTGMGLYSGESSDGKICLDTIRNDDENIFAQLGRLHFEYQDRVVNVTGDGVLSLRWSLELHMCLLSIFRSLKTLAESRRQSSSRPSSPSPSSSSSKAPMLKQLVVSIKRPGSLVLSLPRGHIVEFVVPAGKGGYKEGRIKCITENLTVFFDTQPVIDIKMFKLHRELSSSSVTLQRKNFNDFTTTENSVWTLACKEFKVLFPYGYDFAAAFEETVNTVKWLKLIHEYRKKPFTADSPLPPDWLLKIDEFSMQLNDDPFEVKLRNNYELLIDEQLESERRRQILDQKLEELRKSNPLLPKGKVEELYKSLLHKNAAIYVQRSVLMSESRREHLFVWRLKKLELKMLADRSLHGTENCVRLIRQLNPESALPSDGLLFTTLWARGVELDCQHWTFQFRDYPHSYMSVEDVHVWGHLVGAEQTGSERAIRHCDVQLSSPWGRYRVTRNMFPLKFYYDLCSDNGQFDATYGPCWEPCLAMISMCWNKVNRPSRDPSQPMPFWDKIRLLLHGRFSMMCKQLVMNLLASSDPYDTTEKMEISWDDLGFDWTAGRLLVTANVDAFVRTASKYDDIRLLHLPGLKLSIRMDWVCLGDSHDHHSVTPCAPDRLPDYSLNQEHDSFRAFRSRHLNLSLSYDVKEEDSEQFLSDSKCPQILLYSNTVRWLDLLKSTLSAVNRPIKRGAIFDEQRLQRNQLSRHYKNVEISVSLPRFLISYWMSFSSSYGFRLSSKSLILQTSMQQEISPAQQQDRLTRRNQAAWNVGHVSAELLNTNIHLFGDKVETDANDEQNQSFGISTTKSFFLGLERLAYVRENVAVKSTSEDGDNSDKPIHRLTAYDLRGAWTQQNRDAVLAIIDGVQKARILRRILSTDALKVMQFSEEKPKNASGTEGMKGPHETDSGRTGSVLKPKLSVVDSSAVTANNMLKRLVEEADTKFVAYSEDSTELPIDQLNGVVLCEPDDVIQTRWQIELVNGQMVFKDSDGGFVLCTASRAQVTQRVHRPVWRNTQILDKRAWTALLSGIQYYAPLMGRSCSSAGFRWLPKELIEDRSPSDLTLDTVDSYIGAGPAVGSVVAETSLTTAADETRSEAGSEDNRKASLAPSERGTAVIPLDFPQMQRVISRCSCQVYFCYFSDTFDLEEMDQLPPPPKEDSRAEFWKKTENVDTFTLKHNMLEASTNPQQYQIIMNIINNLILFVDPRKKESEGKRQRLRFKLQVQSLEELRPSILKQQNLARTLVTQIRMLERRAFFLGRKLTQTPDDQELLNINQELEDDMNRQKTDLSKQAEELAMTISLFKEKQLQQVKQTMQMSDENLAPIARRFEVCFEDCTWRLTETDGQLGLAEMQIRNFLYTRISRINNSGDHLLEIGNVKVTNLLPNSRYRDVMQPQHHPNTERQPAFRLVCRDMAPVGGISVKEHLEVNVLPMTVQMTYIFFRTMMKYFFPGKNIDKEDQQQLDVTDDTSSNAASVTSSSSHLKLSGAGAMGKGKSKKKLPSVPSDEIEKMKMRAEKNNMFVYIKIPEVPILVSYKGEKEKNIEDVDSFHLTFPLVEYHDRNWTWLDLALAVKQRSKRVLLQQFMRQKILRHRIIGAFQERHEASTMPEEEKVKVVLGTHSSLASPDRAKSSTKK